MPAIYHLVEPGDERLTFFGVNGWQLFYAYVIMLTSSFSGLVKGHAWCSYARAPSRSPAYLSTPSFVRSDDPIVYLSQQGENASIPTGTALIGSHSKYAKGRLLPKGIRYPQAAWGITHAHALRLDDAPGPHAPPECSKRGDRGSRPRWRQNIVDYN
jgi:hypothetical protein